MSKKRFGFLGVVVAVALVLVACGGSSSSGGSAAAPAKQQITLRMSMAQVEGTPNFVSATETLKPLIEERTQGAYTLAVFGNNTLAGGNQLKAVEMAQKGTIDFAVSSAIVTSNIIPDLTAIAIPWLWKDIDTLHKTMMPGTPVGKRYTELLLEKDLVLLGFAENGFRDLTNNIRPVRTPADIKGLKMRVLSNNMLSDMFRKLGCNVVYIDSGEMYTALQNGTIDGQENPQLSHNYYMKMYEVQKYFTVWEYTYDALLAMTGKSTWEKFDAATQDVMRKSFDEYVDVERRITSAEYDKCMEFFHDYGTQIITLDQKEKDAFYNEIKDVVEKYVPTFDQNLVQLLYEANGKKL
jgi:tripartite ATP-independent transporter DctP family solute receptor